MSQAAGRWSSICMMLLASTTAAQEPPAPPERHGGYVVSEKLLDTVVKRWAFELADNVDLDEAEETQVRDALRKRWVPFFREHQQQLAPLVERWMQAMMDPDPPAAEEVQTFAKSALAMHDLLLEEFNRTEAELTQLLPAEKVGRLRGELAQVRLGMGFMNGRLKTWEGGGLDAGHWERLQNRRTERRQRQRERWNQELEGELARQLTLSDWDQYVQDFVRRFELDEAQKTAANSVLTDVKQRAQAYLAAHADELKQTHGAVEAAADPDRSAALTRRQELVEPVQQLFAELQNRLDNIPTEAQRARAQEGTKPVDKNEPAPQQSNG